mmetsp:Transcript_64613/g.114939  ORF Transcript_64613/g.114939 Transcript_64613/m.114939 type:complete len:85 (+) Transcript_64613:220-474(+)
MLFWEFHLRTCARNGLVQRTLGVRPMERWATYTFTQKELQIIHYNTTQIQWHADESNVWKMWRHKHVYLPHWQGSKRCWEHRKH